MGAVPKNMGYLAGASAAREFETRMQPLAANTRKPGPRKFERVPTHAVGVAHERRRYPRACLCLPLRLTRIEGIVEPIPVTLVTRNISSSGVFFLAPRELKLGTAIELEVALVERPLGFGRVEMCTAAHIVRSEECDTPGWRGYAASFDDFALKRDDVVPLRYLTA